MLLQNLLSGPPGTWVLDRRAPTETEIRSLVYDSRVVEPGALFFAIEGLSADGNAFVDEAVQRGAVAVASQRRPRPDLSALWIQVSSIRRFMAACALSFHGDPSREIQLIGITGTNGKTTTAYLAHSILGRQSPALMLGSIKTCLGRESSDSRLTTPESTDIQRLLRQALSAGCQRGVMEVSSHALFLDRVFGCRFPVAVFTNLTQDHLDFHKGIEEYLASKKLLFKSDYNPGLRSAVVNGDDPYALEAARGCGRDVVTFGLNPAADVRPLNWRSSAAGIRARLSFFDRELELESELLGRHNLYNLMAAAAACSAAGIPDNWIRDGIREVNNVPGRFEKVPCSAPFTVVIDFAHTPDALSNVLDLAREVAERRVVCLFGCGGDRDRTKRPLMGGIATRKADMTLITSDNPRSEDPELIIRQIVSGIGADSHPYEVIPDRRQAIARALRLAQSGDVVVLAGKGHEPYQEIQGQKFPFDERVIVKEALCSA